MNFYDDIENTLPQALTGNPLAWDMLFKQLWPMLTAVAASLLIPSGCGDAVDDVAQNTFVRLMENDAKRLHAFDNTRGSLKGYVAKVAHNCAIDYLRSHSKQLRHSNYSTLSESADESMAIFPMLEEWEMVAALETLSPREREVITLLYKENVGTAAAANRMGVSSDTVRSEKSHALKKLKKFFGQI